jgi:hypothetical protein
MRLKHSDISPDGVRIVIDWDKFVVGTSIFIPCLDTKRAITDIVDASGIPKTDLIQRVRIEEGKYGVRVWRMR